VGGRGAGAPSGGGGEPAPPLEEMAQTVEPSAATEDTSPGALVLAAPPRAKVMLLGSTHLSSSFLTRARTVPGSRSWEP